MLILCTVEEPSPITKEALLLLSGKAATGVPVLLPVHHVLAAFQSAPVEDVTLELLLLL